MQRLQNKAAAARKALATATARMASLQRTRTRLHAGIANARAQVAAQTKALASLESSVSAANASRSAWLAEQGSQVKAAKAAGKRVKAARPVRDEAWARHKELTGAQREAVRRTARVADKVAAAELGTPQEKAAFSKWQQAVIADRVARARQDVSRERAKEVQRAYDAIVGQRAAALEASARAGKQATAQAKAAKKLKAQQKAVRKGRDKVERSITRAVEQVRAIESAMAKTQKAQRRAEKALASAVAKADKALRAKKATGKRPKAKKVRPSSLSLGQSSATVTPLGHARGQGWNAVDSAHAMAAAPAGVPASEQTTSSGRGKEIKRAKPAKDGKSAKGKAATAKAAKAGKPAKAKAAKKGKPAKAKAVKKGKASKGEAARNSTTGKPRTIGKGEAATTPPSQGPGTGKGAGGTKGPGKAPKGVLKKGEAWREVGTVVRVVDGDTFDVALVAGSKQVTPIGGALASPVAPAAPKSKKSSPKAKKSSPKAKKSSPPAKKSSRTASVRTDGGNQEPTDDAGRDQEPAPVLQRVRITGIQAPESQWCGGSEAKNALKRVLPVGTLVRLASRKAESGNAPAGIWRVKRTVYVQGADKQWVDVAPPLLSRGLVFPFPFIAEKVHNDRYLDLAVAASKKQVGLYAPSFCGKVRADERVEVQVVTHGPGKGHDADGEFVIVYNGSDHAIDLSGWMVQDTSPLNAYFFPKGTKVAKDDYVVVSSASGKRGYWPDGQKDKRFFYAGTGARWNNNSIDIAFLFDAKGSDETGNLREWLILRPKG